MDAAGEGLSNGSCRFFHEAVGVMNNPLDTQSAMTFIVSK